MTHPPMRFARLRLESWGNFKHAEVAPARRVVLVGPSASGPSNSRVISRAFPDLATLGQGKVVDDKRGGNSRLDGLAAGCYAVIG